MEIVHFECPHCRLPLMLKYDGGNGILSADPLAWRRLCNDEEAKRQSDGPGLCAYAKQAVQGFFPLNWQG
jgi:hypothetical protein